MYSGHNFTSIMKCVSAGVTKVDYTAAGGVSLDNF